MDNLKLERQIEMIVKVVTRGTGYDSDQSYTFTNLYECSHFSVDEWEDEPLILRIDEAGKLGQISIRLDAPKTEVYIMNNEGKTIDRFETSYKEPNVEHGVSCE